MSFSQPSIQGFEQFISTNMGISAAYLPAGSPWIGWAYGQALSIVNPQLRAAPSPRGTWSPYVLAVYNLGGHILVENAPDVSYPIGAAMWANGLATLTTVGANSINPGDRISISGVSPLPYCAPAPKPFTVYAAAPAQQQFSYAIGQNPGPGTVLSGATVSETYFTTLRADLKLNAFSPGLVNNASDQGTGVGLENPRFMENLTLIDLQYLKSPWGRAYEAIAMRVGSLWGLS